MVLYGLASLRSRDAKRFNDDERLADAKMNNINYGANTDETIN